MNFDLKFYLSLFLRRLPVMLTLFLICAALGVSTAINQEPSYTTTARLLVEDAQIDINNNANEDAREKLQIIRERLLTRANLIDIANKFTVFDDMRSLTPDKIIEQMRESTQIRETSGRNAATLMTITFEARSGQIAAAVVNEYLTLIQQDNSSNSVSQVENELEFFRQEVARLGEDLDLQSVKIVQFKDANARALPDDLDHRYDRQTLLQERFARLERDKSQAETQKADIVRLFEATGRINASSDVVLTPEQQQLQQLQLELQQARAVYSDTNPKVVLLTSQVQQLEQIVRQIVPDEISDEFVSEDTTMLQVAITEIDARIASLEVESVNLAAEIVELEDSIAATSRNAIALSALERDFDNIQNRYNSAVGNLDRARMNQRIDLSSLGQRITVIEGANVPREPSGPNRLKIAALGIGAGLALAAGFFALLEFTNRTIRRPVEIESRFNVSPIAAIPYMETQRQKLLRRGLLVLALLTVLIGVPALLWYIDTNVMPLDLIAAKIVVRLGL